VPQPLPIRPVDAKRYDSVNKRNGMASVFMTFEPLAGCRHAKPTSRRSAVGFAHVMRELLDGRYREAGRIGSWDTAARHVAACEQTRDNKQILANWPFAPADARTKLRKRYLTVDG
jgi:hypothetical protein